MLNLLPALLLFTFVASVTPGPNNLMVLTSGVNFGVLATVPHMLGIGIGFTLMVFLVCLGVGQIFVLVPALYSVLKIAGIVYMLWLAWKIAGTGPVKEGAAVTKPLSFMQAALFQWVNPKGWVMAITASATYSLVGWPVLSAFVIAGAFALASLPSNLIWVFFGSGLKHLLSSPRSLRIFNVSMALLLVLSLIPLIWL